ncbi:uncharacterized protein LY79DRAFT_530086 [Colletotrichum navitas]|uniref:Uncharacterized protein n=1 Tax=Colletotrichum navitas TaxID=681940 RepID=A0AAD8UYA9_9PEZI|nr:uncharacterized protein LY79DRAFT_530086 [Colletotrichum navitas]KAK1565865.1 hypothetical protein LY79DRAFT_530086 [Colletotrichum navitas]
MLELTAKKPNLNNAFLLLVLQQASRLRYPSEAVMHAGNPSWPLITNHDQRPSTP